jgi:hypothetical protein
MEFPLHYQDHRALDDPCHVVKPVLDIFVRTEPAGKASNSDLRPGQEGEKKGVGKSRVGSWRSRWADHPPPWPPAAPARCCWPLGSSASARRPQERPACQVGPLGREGRPTLIIRIRCRLLRDGRGVPGAWLAARSGTGSGPWLLSAPGSRWRSSVSGSTGARTSGSHGAAARRLRRRELGRGRHGSRSQPASGRGRGLKWSSVNVRHPFYPLSVVAGRQKGTVSP